MEEVGEGSSAGEESEEEGGALTPITQNTSNHYTLNLPAPAPPKSDTPYVLLGCVAMRLLCVEGANR